MRLVQWIVIGVSSGGMGGGLVGIFLYGGYGEVFIAWGVFGSITGIIGGLFIGAVIGIIANIARIHRMIGGSIIGLLSGAFGALLIGGINEAGISKDGSQAAIERAVRLWKIGTIMAAVIGLVVGLIILIKLDKGKRELQ